MTKENEFSKTFEEFYEDWLKKPFPTDKEEIEDKVIKYDDEKAFDELLNATSETEFEKIVQIA